MGMDVSEMFALYESKFIESIVKEIADKLNPSLPHVPPSALPLSSALRPPSYFFGLLREWRRSFFQTPSLSYFFLTSPFVYKQVQIWIRKVPRHLRQPTDPVKAWMDELIKGLYFNECFSLIFTIYSPKLGKKEFDHVLDLKRNIGEPSSCPRWQCFSGDWIVSALDGIVTARV
ncbi:hypothetical protein NC651_012222 [Populus alba x Populus x berolinensis]|nr:hypothetical protein NC651_012222 [Populus alba x Populus x berolinensis]